MRKHQSQEIFGREDLLGRKPGGAQLGDVDGRMRKLKEAAENWRMMRRCIVMPDSNMRSAWDFIAVVLIFFVAINLPFRLAFNTMSDLAESATETDGWAVVDLMIDLFFLILFLVPLPLPVSSSVLRAESSSSSSSNRPTMSR